MIGQVKNVVGVLLLASLAKAELKEHWRLDEGSGSTAFNGAGYKKDDVLQKDRDATVGGGVWQPLDGFGGAFQLILIVNSIDK